MGRDIILKCGEGCHKGLWLQLLDSVVDTGVVEHGPKLEALLGIFAELFEEPKGFHHFGHMIMQSSSNLVLNQFV